jgi:hypothetical protein
MVAGLAAAAVAVVVGVLAVTGDREDSPQPAGPTPTPTVTPTDGSSESTKALDLPANGRIVGAEDLFAGALRPCSVINADHELATPEAECTIGASDVDPAADIGLFAETSNDTVTLRVATPNAGLGRFPHPFAWQGDTELGPEAGEISLSHGQEIAIVGYDGRQRRNIDLSAVLVPPDGNRAEEITELEWSPDGTRIAVVTHLNTWQGDRRRWTEMSSRLWIVDRDGGRPQLVHTATNPGPVPANNTPLGYVGSLTWSPDGASLGFIEEFAYIGASEESQSTRAATLILSESGDPVPRTLYIYASGTYHDEAQIVWSPDGARVALRVPGQVLELSAADGRVLERHPLIAGKLIWLAREQ